MAHIVIIATGGTIASASTQGDLGAVAERTAAELVDGADFGGVDVTHRDLFNLGSYLLGHKELRLIAEAVSEEIARDDVDGVVVTHGTDTMEETAYLLDLIHDSSKPVVLTGAQRPADVPDTDGPRNLAEAITVAASPAARDCGALIVFAGRIFSARSTRKQHTIAPEPFASGGGGELGHVLAGTVHIHARPVRPPALALPDARFDETRVDVVTAHPGADASLARAAVAAGARGIVLAGTGVGNGNHALLNWAHEAISTGVPVVLSTRVPRGPVVPYYGNAGGVDFVTAGAITSGYLPLYHSRLLLALLLVEGGQVDQELFSQFTD